MFKTRKDKNMNCKDEGKTFCMRQVNPNNDRAYFGAPWNYDENWLGCYFCRELGFGRKCLFEAPTGMLKERPKLKRRLL